MPVASGSMPCFWPTTPIDCRDALRLSHDVVAGDDGACPRPAR